MVERIRIPCSAVSRRERTYARLILRAKYSNVLCAAFEGPLFRPGAMIDAAQLWPTPEAPETPLLLEYAGSDFTGWGHRRSNHTHILWKLDTNRGEWVELVRCAGRGSEWLAAVVPAAIAALDRPETAHESAELATRRVLTALDGELEFLPVAERGFVLNVLYEQVTARVAASFV